MTPVRLLRLFEDTYANCRGMPWIGKVTPQQAFGDAASLIEELVSRLNDARSAIASLDTWALGEAENGGGTVWPIRDELLHHIDQTLSKASADCGSQA